MIRNRTVFVLGAGASMPYGYPSGASLLRALQTKPGYTLSDAASDQDRERRQVELDLFRGDLIRAKPESIDDFLLTRGDHAKVAKRCVASHLITCEADNPDLHAKDDENDDWLLYVWNRMKSDPRSFPQNQVVFVSFNYDRLVEHYFTSAMAHCFNISPSEAWRAVSQLRFIHVHGALGDYLAEGSTTDTSRRYGNRLSEYEEIVAARGIRTMGEAGPTDSMSRMIAKEVATSEKVVFLGFGYIPSNMSFLEDAILSRHVPGPTPLRTYGTALGLGLQRSEQLKRTVFKEAPGRLMPEKCCKLLRDYVPLE